MATTLITGTVGCNGDESETGPHDAGFHDTASEDATSDVGADAASDASDVDGTESWPEQEIDDEPFGIDWDMPEADGGLSVLVANVGNVDLLRCGNVDYNLCWTEQEEIVTDHIAARSPDVILLQEVLTPDQCQALEGNAVDDDHVCHPDHDVGEPEQVRRLLGPDYTIACDARNGYECVGTRIGRATIQGCDDGELCRGLARTGAPVEDCDPGFTVSAVTIGFDGRTLDVVNVHPPSDAPGVSDPPRCRREYFENFFGSDASLLEDEDVFVGGDFNFDPYRQSDDNPDVELWNQHVSTSFDQTQHDPHSFAYHSGIVEHDPPYWTSPILEQTLDHAISNSLRGRCITLGAHPGEAPLDEFHGGELERLDHLALECVLD